MEYIDAIVDFLEKNAPIQYYIDPIVQRVWGSINARLIQDGYSVTSVEGSTVYIE